MTVHQVISDWNTPKNLAPFLTGVCPHRDRCIISKVYAFFPTALHPKIRTKPEAEAQAKQVQRPTAWKMAAAKLPGRWSGRSPVFFVVWLMDEQAVLEVTVGMQAMLDVDMDV